MYGKPLRIVTDHKACLALQSGRGLNRHLLRVALTLQGRPIEIELTPALVNTPLKSNLTMDLFLSWQTSQVVFL